VNKLTIEDISAFEVFDSRGNPTLACEVRLSDDSSSISYVPSGASAGKYEALEIRDKDETRFFGRGVSKAVNVINNEIKELLAGLDPLDQTNIDSILCKADGTNNKSTFGANTILVVSLANLRVSAKSRSLPLYECVNLLYKDLFEVDEKATLPNPMMNILNGGVHADNNIDFQEFMIQPSGFSNFKSAFQCGVEIYHELKEQLKKQKLNISVGDEGGFAPQLDSAEEALDLILKAIDVSGYKAGSQVFICLDCASSELFNEGQYLLRGIDKSFNSNEMINYLNTLKSKYPINSIEDGLDEDDWEGWKSLTKSLGSEIQLVGDDLFVTNTNRIKKGIKQKVANSVLVKINQIGTISEAMEAVNLSKENGYKTIISHRSGETEDTSIADIAIGLNSGQIKTGAPCRTDRVAKYNRMLILEEKFNIPFSGIDEVT
jgi:enolase